MISSRSGVDEDRWERYFWADWCKANWTHAYTKYNNKKLEKEGKSRGIKYGKVSLKNSVCVCYVIGTIQFLVKKKHRLNKEKILLLLFLIYDLYSETKKGGSIHRRRDNQWRSGK